MSEKKGKERGQARRAAGSPKRAPDVKRPAAKPAQPGVPTDITPAVAGAAIRLE